MESLFAAQPIGMPPMDGFTPNATPQQQAQMFGEAMDAEHIANLQRNPRQSVSNQVPKFMPKKYLKYMKVPIPRPADVKVGNNVISAFQRYNYARTPGEMAVKSLHINGRAGEEAGRQALQLVKAALSIASRASTGQLEASKIGPGLRQIYEGVFPRENQTPQAPVFLAQLGKFMESEDIRDTLATYRRQDGVQDQMMRTMYQESLQPGNSLVELASLTNGGTSLIAAARGQVARTLKFQRHLPHYSAIGSTPQHIIRKVKDQQRSWNGFKPKGNDRFVYV